MSQHTVRKRQLTQRIGRGALLGKHLLARLDVGLLIDRRVTPVGYSHLHVVTAPKSLTRKPVP